jgi:PAS domain S-box
MQSLQNAEQDNETSMTMTLLQQSPVAIFAVNPCGVITFWNRTAEHMFGWTAQEVLGGPNPVVPPCQYEDYRHDFNIALHGKAFSGHRSQPKRKDGSTVEARISAAPIYCGEDLIGVTFVVEDVTRHVLKNRRALAELLHSQNSHGVPPQLASREDLLYGDDVGSRFENADQRVEGITTDHERALLCIHACWALKLSEQRYRALVETMRDGLATQTSQGRLTYVNSALSDLLGYTPEQLVGRTWWEFLVPECQGIAQLRLASYNCYGESFELSWRRCDGTTLPTLVSLQFLQPEHDGASASFLVVTDITQVKRIQLELEEKKEQLQSKQDSLAEMNSTLRVLIQKRSEDKAELEEKVLANVQELVMPLLAKLQRTGNREQIKMLELLEQNIKDIVSPFARALFYQNIALSPRELQVANYVKMGMSTKEIAETANLSPKTVEDHRKAIRHKLGLHAKKANLRTYLHSLQDGDRGCLVI